MKISQLIFKARLFSVLSVILFLCACASSQHINIVVSPKYYQKQQMNIAVLDFDYKKGDTVASLLYGSGSATDAGKMIGDLLTSHLMSLPNVTVVERSRLKAVLKEKNLTISGLLESNQLAEVANIAGIDAIIIGSVGDASGGNAVLIYQKSSVSFSARCVRASDAVVLWSGSITKVVGTDETTRVINETVKAFSKELIKKLCGQGK